MADGGSGFNLSTVFAALANTIPDHRVLVWRGQEWTYAALNDRVDGVAHYLASLGLGCHTERDRLQGHESGQDHVGLYLRNGNQYLEAMIGGYRARIAPFNVNYRYVEAELLYLLDNAKARALVYNAEFAPRVAAIRDQLPHLEFLIQVADHTDQPLLPGAVDYESIIDTPPPVGGMPTPTGDDLFVLYTGGTTGMPKGVLWRQHDVFVSSMGGTVFGTDQALTSYDEVAARAAQAPGVASVLLIPPLMHGAAQWGAFQIMTMGGWIAFPDDVESIRADQILRLAEREGVLSIPVVGDAIARPLADEMAQADYDLSRLVSISNGGAALTPAIRKRLTGLLPHLVIIDNAGASESGLQMSAISTDAAPTTTATFSPNAETALISSDFTRVLDPGDDENEGWLARRNLIPLGYLGDAEKTARTFPVIDGVRWSVPGDRARLLADGRIELLGRDAVTINSGGEKIFAEEVEAAMAEHPDVYDVVVAGRPAERWGNEVVAIVQLVEGSNPTDDELLETCQRYVARYKLPKAIIRTPKVQRSPAGKADYRWAKAVASEHT